MKHVNGRFIPDKVGELDNQYALDQMVALLTECANAFSATVDGDTLALTGLSVAGASTFTLGAANVITIDAGTTDHTASTVITMDVDVNSANCKAINIDLDVGTALSSGEAAYGVYVDVAGLSGDNAASILGAFYATGDTTSGGAVNGLTLAGAWDTAVLISGTSTTALRITGNATTAIAIATGTFTTGISIAGTLTTGLSIGAATSCITITATGSTAALTFDAESGCLDGTDGTYSTADGFIKIKVGVADYRIPYFAGTD